MNDRRKIERFMKIKERLRQARRTELAEADRTLAVANERMAEAQSSERRAIRTLTNPGDVAAKDLNIHASLVKLAQQDTHAAQTKVNEASVVREERSGRVIEASRESKMLEVIHRRVRHAENKHMQRKDQKLTDETAARRKEKKLHEN